MGAPRRQLSTLHKKANRQRTWPKPKVPLAQKLAAAREASKKKS